MNQPNKPRSHLFSPHTDQCIYCGKSAQDDAIENTPCGCDEPRPCDACQKFENEEAALEAVVKAAEAQPALLKFVEEVASLKHEDEPCDDGSFEPTSEDSIATLNQLILDARQRLGTADKCSRCQAIVPYVIGCPDGAELCQDCFDAGQLHASGL
jgi:hypothetical protein